MGSDISKAYAGESVDQTDGSEKDESPVMEAIIEKDTSVKPIRIDAKAAANQKKKKEKREKYYTKNEVDYLFDAHLKQMNERYGNVTKERIISSTKIKDVKPKNAAKKENKDNKAKDDGGSTTKDDGGSIRIQEGGGPEKS